MIPYNSTLALLGAAFLVMVPAPGLGWGQLEAPSLVSPADGVNVQLRDILNGRVILDFSIQY